uniref:HlyD family type I secretion periplasmic adaptor subunit n=1 Tax=Thermodesulfobacterium geofontis TaxID=1295609 RepID=A0A7C4JRM3_9BACT
MKDHYEFKPILVEIEEKPVNPLGRIILWSVFLLIIITLIALYIFKVDIIVPARGKVIPDGDVKVLQSFETGVVKKIMVKEGDFVKEGDILIEIDPTIEISDIQEKEKLLSFHTLTKQRVQSLLTEKNFKPSQDNENSALQLALYKSQKEYYLETLKQKQKEIEEIQTVINATKDEIDKLENILLLVSEEEKRYKALSEIGAIPENRYREKLKEKVNLEREIDLRENQIKENLIRLERLKHEIETFKNSFNEKLLSEMSSSYERERLLFSDITNIKFKKSKRFITSPVNGYVHLLAIKTIGGVVTPGQPLISIVPEDTPLIIRAMVLNKDIGFVKEKQNCIIKVDTYDFQKYGTLKGEVKTISPFSIEDKELGVDGYPVYIKLNSTELKTKDGKIYKIKPGMSVLAEINIGKRRVIELFVFPFIKHIDEGLKVR